MTKIEAARQEYVSWSRSLGISSAADVNRLLEEGMGIRLINLCEARQERQYAAAADCIARNCSGKRIVMMSGPSSSGKTSSSLRIAQQCLVLGLIPKVIELDNYFVDRDKTPLDENGEYDFEALGAMNTELLGENLNDLLAGKEVVVPRYDFTTGKSVMEESGRMKLEEGELLFMEGIHALNPALTSVVDQDRIFHVYISALSALDIGEHVHGSCTDKRLMRRIVRDYRTRATSAESNILRWPSVRRGETLNIFPFEENADVVFNSSTLYDVPLLRCFAEPLLLDIPDDSPARAKADSLLAYMRAFNALSPAEIEAIPPTSVMREFIGGQTLY